MDEIDKRLIAELQKNCRISYQELSRVYGISANAIRRRILHLEETGEIAGYSVSLSPAMVGAEQLFGLLFSDGSRDEFELVEEIGSHPNIIAAAAYSNGTYALIAEYRGSDELLSVSSYLRRIDGIVGSELHPILVAQGAEMELSSIHLRVLKWLFENPRMSIVEIAKNSGLTARRVRRILDELENSGAVKFRALVELGAASSIPFIVKISWDEKKTTYVPILEWIEKTYPLIHWESFVSASEPVIYSLLSAENITGVTELTREIRRHPLVLNVLTIINKYHKFFPRYRQTKLLEMINAPEKRQSA
ncbi:Lrp/AsnC family transcriptional regulator [Candidatus Thorarchaeota archaeon]|nr:MAG: Lrp/AsnC family transcriptional regulator [Candidatus Thorarchaeota archaeon]